MARQLDTPAPRAVHRGIFGRTLCGKTALAKFMARDASRHGLQLAVFDPLADPGWPLRRGDFMTRDRDEFRHFIRTNKRRLVIIDESSKALDRYDPADDWPFTMGRHLGHLAIVIGQHPKMINPVVRGQLSKCYIFALPASQAQWLASEWGRPELVQVANFPACKLMEVSGFTDTRIGQLDFKSKGVRWQSQRILRRKNAA